LPTEAEWNYAAAGGAEQRIYPWGNATPDSTLAVFNGNLPAIVGSTSPKGDGKFGQADLAGNLDEWVRDVSAPYVMAVCDNCAVFTGPSGANVYRGGSFEDKASGLLSSVRGGANSITQNVTLGARCARSP
jgi:formylglycine-generating enzyme required for sulfatase activity